MHVVLTQKKNRKKIIFEEKISGFFLFVNKIQIYLLLQEAN